MKVEQNKLPGKRQFFDRLREGDHGRAEKLMGGT